MALHVAVQLQRGSYFPGESLSAVVRVTTSSDVKLIHVAELVVECFGIERVDPSWISSLYLADVPSVKDHRRVSRKIFSCEPIKLLSSQHLLPGHLAEYAVRVKLPAQLPPTFRGSSIRFSYHFQARAEYTCEGEAASRLCDCQLAFTVWPAAEPQVRRQPSISHGGAPSISHSHSAAAAEEQQYPPLISYQLNITNCKLRWQQVVPAQVQQSALQKQLSVGSQNSLSKDQLARTSLSPLSWSQELEADGIHSDSASDTHPETPHMPMSPSHKNPGPLTVVQRASMAARSYNLKAGDHPLVRITLQPPLEALLQPGGTLGGVLDFRCTYDGSTGSRDTRPTCVQVVALLETEEVISSAHRHASSTSDGVIRRLYWEHQELTPDTLVTHFMFSIPPHAPPSFKTPMVSLRWVVRFELSINWPKGVPKGSQQDPLVWALPIVVFPRQGSYSN